MPRRKVGGYGITGTPSGPIAHIDRQIPPTAHTPMYVWHKYWSRKTWNVVAEYIKTYCPEGGVVLDPFAGSGVVACEALKHGRRAIICDLLPIATEIARLTIKPVVLDDLQHAFQRVEARVKSKILALYETECRNRKCRTRLPFTCAIWDKGRLVEIRYEKCPECGDRREARCPPTLGDDELLRKIEATRIKEWYPDQRLYYPEGKPFMKKEKYESLDQLFTKRNLQALAWLMEAIEAERSPALRDFLKIGFTSMVHLCSKMVPAIAPTPGSHQTSFSSTWSQQSLWSVPKFMEQNVWLKFESAFTGHQGLLKAKKESNDFYDGKIPGRRAIRFARDAEEVLSGKADVYIHSGDSLAFMQRLAARHPEGCVDYIFTDPPYDASIQFGELAFLWVAWLKEDAGYLERLQAHEVVRNERQGKSFDVYHALLKNAFSRMYEALKPDRYSTVTFHNPTFKVRNATIYAGVAAGFDFEKVHHQPLGQVSAKAMLQPFGSAQGDFYLRFHKPVGTRAAGSKDELDERRFEQIVVETMRHVLAERGEPTPYTILINAIDPALAQAGFFRELHTGLDVKAVLQANRDKEFVLMETRLGGVKGQSWWLKDENSVAHLKSVPLTERVEQTVLRKLQERGQMDYTDMWAAISEEFPNSMTSDATSIREALEAYAIPTGKSLWRLNPNYDKKAVERKHTRIVAMLAEVGKTHGYRVWVGKREQSDDLAEAGMGMKGKLGDLVTARLDRVANADNLADVERIDVLWVRDARIAAVFEVESTTAMTEALKRGSNVGASVPKYLVMPQDREEQLKRKLKSPLFEESYRNDSWRVVFFETLEHTFEKERGKTDVESLVSKRIAVKGFAHPNQIDMFRDLPAG